VEWRKLCKEELHILYSFPNIIRQDKSRKTRWAKRVARMEEERKMYRYLVEKPEEKRSLRRPRRKWENEFRVDLKRDWLGVWIGSIWLSIGADGGLL
jgi:hypothetical protein